MSSRQRWNGRLDRAWNTSTASNLRRRRVRPLPYVLLVPAVLALGLMLGFPLVRLVTLSLQEFGLKQQFGAAGRVGRLRELPRRSSRDAEFWAVLRRTVVFCAVNVALTMALGMAVALLLQQLGTKMRLLTMIGLMLAWAMPALTATVIWQWIFDTQYGIANWLLGRQGESWLSNPLTFYFVATIIVVWMGIPFIAFTLYAGLTQIPDEMMEAAAIDGATRMAAVPRHRRAGAEADPVDPHLAVGAVGLPGVHPDLRAADAPAASPATPTCSASTPTASRSAPTSSTRARPIAIVMVLITVLMTLFYLRSMVRQEEL